MMAQINGMELADIPQVKNLLCSVSTNVTSFFKTFRTSLSNILPPINHDTNEIQGEVWRDLSAVYYKYEDEFQKKAFRQVVNNISKKIEAGNWDSIYKRLYRIEHNS
jgi:hypothetical protein